MSFVNLPFVVPTEQGAIHAVYEEIGIDVDKVENTAKLIRDWLKCEDYLPDEIDDVLVRNFIFGCKGNLEKTKSKLEKYLTARTKMTSLYKDRTIKNEIFVTYPYHRMIYICPKQTPERNRVVVFRFAVKDPTHFEHFKLAKFLLLVCDLFLLYDTSAGYHFVYDCTCFSPQYMAKFNLALVKQLSELFYNILPFRIRSLLMVNENAAIQLIMNIGKMFMSEKLQKRISSVKAEDLPNYHPKEYLPIEYGGTQGHFNEVSDQLLEVLRENVEWCKKTEEIQLKGPVAEHKKYSCSFEDFNMDGSFRKLAID